jgi:hypothetical protein
VLFKNKIAVRFEAFTAVTMKNVVFWDVALCRSCVNRRFGGKHRLHLQGRRIRGRGTSVSCQPAHAGFPPEDSSTLKMEAILFSETSVNAHPRRRHSSIKLLFIMRITRNTKIHSLARMRRYVKLGANRVTTGLEVVS